MSLYNGPPRPGARGGKDQFSWENVKSDKDREFYLGHSVKASVGRWQKGKDIFWYAREKEEGSDSRVQDELSLVRKREEELMMEALGLKPKKVRSMSRPQLDQREMKQLLDGSRGGEDVEEDASPDGASMIQGVGFRSGQILGSGEAMQHTLAGIGVSKLPGAAVSLQQLPPPPHINPAELKKHQKAHQKEQRKLEKQAKKMAKREAKKSKKSEKRKGRTASRPFRISNSDESASPPLLTKRQKQ